MLANRGAVADLMAMLRPVEPALHLILALSACAVVTVGACATAGSTPGVGERLPEPESVFDNPDLLEGETRYGRYLALSSEVRIVVAAPSDEIAERAMTVAFAAADSVERLVSVHFSGSEIGAINEAAGVRPVPVSPWTERIILATIRWADRTGGAFDPTVGPLAELWGFGTEVVRAPTPAEREAVRARIGYSRVEIDPDAHTVFLPDTGMRLDVRGAAKGFALDRMREAMQAAGATAAMMEFDGDKLFFGSGPQNGSWPILLADPYDPSRNYAYLVLPPGAVSTSSFYTRSIEIAGRRYGHVLDPRTGVPVSGVASVSVYAKEGVISDILATSLFVMSCQDGPECREAAALVERHPELEAIIVPEPAPGDNAIVTVTSGLSPYVVRLQRPFRPPAEID